MVTRSHPWRRSRTAHSSSATAVCNPSPPALSLATSAPPAARPRLSPTPPADTTNPSTRDARYFASGASSLVASNSGASLSNAVAGAAHEAALVSVSGAATRRASRAGARRSGANVRSGRPRSTAASAVAAVARVRSIFSAACFSRAATTSRSVSASAGARAACAAASAAGSVSIAASRTHDPTSPRLSTQ